MQSSLFLPRSIALREVVASTSNAAAAASNSPMAAAIIIYKIISMFVCIYLFYIWPTKHFKLITPILILDRAEETTDLTLYDLFY